MDAESSFRATPHAVRKLQQVLQRIAENDGNMVAKELWREEDIESDLVSEQTKKIKDIDVSISLGYSRLKQLQELLDTIGFLKSSVERRISHFCLRKRKRTLMDLPDELLAYIFEMTSPGLLVLKDWSLVCKKMRRITISTPRLWTYQRISLSMSPTTIEKIMRRSGTHGHDLLVKSPLVPNEALSKHCHRWSAITLDELTESDFQLFQSLAPSLKLTSLCSLSLTPPNSNSYVFNSDWRPANLKRLSCYKIIPTELPVSTLTYCYLWLKHDSDIHRLATFLSSAPLLEGLHLVAFCGASGLEGTVVELPSLQHFSFCLDDATFLQVISMPNVTTLSIEVFDYDSMDRLWTVVKGIEGKFKHLESLELEVTYMVSDEEEDEDLHDEEDDDLHDEEDEDKDDALYMDELLASFPDSIKSLSLTIRHKILHANRYIPFGTFKDLRTVRFKDCNCLDFDFFEDLAYRFGLGKILLDVLDIWNCQTFSSKKCVEEEAVKVLFRDYGVLQM